MNGIIINGELHELVDTHGSYCQECSLQKQCKDAMDVCGFTYCSISGKVCNKEIFVNRGKIKNYRNGEKSMKHNESHIQQVCVQGFRLRHPDILLFSIPNGGRRDASTGALLKKEGAVAGAPDLQLLKANNKYHGLFIEMKTDTGRQSPEQIAFQAKAEREGYCYIVCRSWDDFNTKVEAYLADQPIPADKPRRKSRSSLLEKRLKEEMIWKNLQ